MKGRLAWTAVALAVLALLACLWWSPPGDLPRPDVPGASALPAPAAVVEDAPGSQAPDTVPAVPDPARRLVTGPSGVHVVCVWAEDGTPAAGVSVRVLRRDGGSIVGSVGLLATDATGSATFTTLLPGDYEFWILVNRHRERARVEPGVLAEIRVEVNKTADIRGTVVDAAARPLAAAEVATEIDGLPVTVATTGNDGRFTARLCAGSGIWARKEGYVPCPLQPVKNVASDIVLRLESAAGSLRGVVVDPEDRAVPHARVAIGIDLETRGRTRQPPVLLATDEREEFATTQVPVGMCVVFASADDFAFGEQKVAIEQAAAPQVIVRLRRPAVVHGTVFGGDHGDEALCGVSMSVHRLRDLSGLTSGISDNLTRTYTVTDRSGRYRMIAPPGRSWIMALATAGKAFHYPLLGEGEDHEWNPDLSPPPGVIRGALLGPGGEPLAGWSVKAHRVDLIDMNMEQVQAETSLDGRFELLHLRRLPHTLTVTSQGETVATRTDVQPDQEAFEWRLSGLPAQSGAIFGRLLTADGGPVKGGKCKAGCDGASRSVVVGADGRFRIERVFPGTWHVTGEVDGYGAFDLGRCGVLAEAAADIGMHSLPAPGRAIVRVVGRDFEPTGVALAMEQNGGAGNKAAEFTVDRRVLRSPALPPGDYQLFVRGHDFAPVMRELTILPGAEVAVDVEVERATPVAIEFVPEDLGDRTWQDLLRIEVRDARGEVVWKHRQNVQGAPTALWTVGLAAGAYAIDAWSNMDAYRRGSADFIVRPAASGPQEVKVLLPVQVR